MRRTNDTPEIAWTVTQVSRHTGRALGRELPAKVPGDVFTDLMRAGIIADPYIGMNSRKARWVHDFDWRYRGEFAAPGPGKRRWLEFDGLDYRSTIDVSGERLRRGEGMFSRITLEIGRLLRDRNEVQVTFAAFPDHWLETKFPPIIVNTEPIRRRVLKTQMSFGWDFSPLLKTCGIWDDVRLFSTGPARIDGLWVRAANDGRVAVEITVDSGGRRSAMIELTVTGENFAGGEVTLTVPAELEAKADNRITARLQVPDPRLWWPWDQGDRNLYRLTARVATAGGVSDEASEVFGFRELRWERNPGSPPSALDWTLSVNGRRVFLRGANFVPPDSMPGRMDPERYLALVQLARDANLNTLRLWGGGNRERAVFYDACDRMGILVWQEFPIGCLSFGAPRSKHFLSLLEKECAAIVHTLRNHPSVMMWCGGNEFNVHLSRPAIRAMARVCRDHDPDRRFVPASPYRGDAHNWIVWHLKGNLADYLADDSQLVSEFGLQAPPAVESLREFLPGESLWPAGPGWRNHHLSPAKMDKYVRRFGGPATNVEQYVAAGQEAQAHFLHRAIEHWRRQKYRKSGALVWQWNEPWPAISWAVVDYYLRPKKSYDRLRLAFQPLLVCADFESKSYRPGDRLLAGLWLVNDFPRGFDGLEIEVRINSETVRTLAAAVGTDEAVRVGEVEVVLPNSGPPVLELTARQAGAVVSENRYHLKNHDPDRASRLARRLFRRWWQFLSE